MRPGSALLLALLTLLAVVACSSGPAVSWSPTRFTAAQRHQEVRRRPHAAARLRVKRQISEIVRLYNELSKENRDDREQAVSRIQAILEGVFAAPNVTSTTPDASTKEGNDNSTEATSTSRPPPRLDREMLVANLRRNLRGLGRLFMRELRAALNQSGQNLKSFGSDIWNTLQPTFSRG
ncbi:hypothetical protein B566_EDAN012910 [Ephemera danica]|nr:hypothetical protein B566_EDAN012910 [Ephemera danica]